METGDGVSGGGPTVFLGAETGDGVLGGGATIVLGAAITVLAGSVVAAAAGTAPRDVVALIAATSRRNARVPSSCSIRRIVSSM